MDIISDFCGRIKWKYKVSSNDRRYKKKLTTLQGVDDDSVVLHPSVAHSHVHQNKMPFYNF